MSFGGFPRIFFYKNLEQVLAVRLNSMGLNENGNWKRARSNRTVSEIDTSRFRVKFLELEMLTHQEREKNI
jgi:hypothetical protein